MKRTAVINVVGLTPDLLGPATPNLNAFVARGTLRPVETVVPAVTCSVQSTYLTGVLPTEHGIVGNGWYFRDRAEVKLWQQSNRLVEHEKIWDVARRRDASFTCANLFWWYNMYSSVDVAVTPRPMYPADGRKLPDIYTWPLDLRAPLQRDLGPFPLFNFWGPNTSVVSSQWIADCSRTIEALHQPTLSLVYLPHLDYVLQKVGPNHADVQADLAEIDTVCGDLIAFYEARDVQVVVLSEYGIVDVSRPVHLNRILREHGWVTIREELGRELLDAGSCPAFAVADHQIAHVYLNDPSIAAEVRRVLQQVPGVAQVLGPDEKPAHGLDHARAGDFVVLAEPDAWFTYYYWLDDARAPDFARTVDIHRKPGYDPVELFVDPNLRAPMAKVGYTVLKKKLGFRYLMDVIPLDATLVKGSHGVLTPPSAGPLFATSRSDLIDTAPDASLPATDVHDLLLRHVFD
ncbi:MAG: nucleotide pyrophosphatase/phosphodiesterase family protein [Bacteroidota bacterium]